MPRKKNKRRDVWFNIHITRIPKGLAWEEIKGRLKDSIRNQEGNYALPRGWDVQVGWKNKEEADMKWGEWSQELALSAASSSGFEKALIGYIRSVKDPRRHR